MKHLHLLLTCACLFAVSAHQLMAQEQAAPEADMAATEPAPTTAPPTAPTTEPAPTTAPAVPVAEVPPTPPSEILPDGRIILNFRDASLSAVLTFLSEAAGIIVISDGQIEGKVNVISRLPVTIDEAISVLNTVLKDRGLAALRTGKTLKIIPLDAAKKANIPVHIGSDPTLMPESDAMITQVIPVRYADAVQLKTDLAPLIPAYAELAANKSTNTLILTDTESNVRRIVQIIRSLDTSVSAVTAVKVFPLKFANAGNSARLINEIFKAEAPTAQQQQGRNAARFFQRQGPGGGGATAQPDEGNRPELKVNAASDDRTNTVVVSAPVDTMPVIEQVLHDLDANPAQDQAVFMYYLKNADAANVEAVINALFNTTGGTRTPTSTSQSNQRTTGTQQGTTRNIGTGGTGTRTGTTGGAQRGTTNTATTGQRNTNTAAARVSPGAAATAADLAGQVYAVADRDTNSMLIMTGSGNFPRVKTVLDELDRPVPQVLIKVLIAEVTHTNDKDLGLEFSAINLKTSGKTSIFTDFGVAAAQIAAGGMTGGLGAKLVESDVDVALHALARVGKVDVLSRPYILTSDNRLASIFVGEDVPYIDTQRITDQGQIINTIAREQLGIRLDVTPHINPDGLVVMDIAPEISAISTTLVPISSTESAPGFTRRNASTRVGIRDGQTIVIGGLMGDRKELINSKVPILGDLPLVGKLLQRNTTFKTKTELLIFLTPHVAMSPEELKELAEHERNRATITPKAVEPGVFEQHMEGMQR